MTKSTVMKPEGEHYDTTDQMMCEVLLMAGFVAKTVVPGTDGQLIYTWVVDEVWVTVEAILLGQADRLSFTYADWWKARITWQMNLRHLSQTRANRR